MEHHSIVREIEGDITSTYSEPCDYVLLQCLGFSSGSGFLVLQPKNESLEDANAV